MQDLVNLLSGFNLWSVCFRLLLAAVLGGCIGVERGRHGRPAGMRTYVLVCVGACLATLLGQFCVQNLQYSVDPLRVGAQVVSGIGFLGVGTIISDRNAHVTGLTTAAGLWTAACMGLAIGMGFYWGALVAFAIMLVAITVLSPVERSRKAAPPAVYYLEINGIESVNAVCAGLEAFGTVRVIPANSGLPGHVGLLLTVEPGTTGEGFLQRLQAMEQVAAAIPTSL